MKFRTLTRRSLRYYWRSHLGVLIGAAIGSAALIGALIVGDSVKGSLRERALERLGGIKFVLDGGDRVFTDTLGDRMPRGVTDGWIENGPNVPADAFPDLTVFFEGGPGAVLRVQGMALVPGEEARANRVQILGVYRKPEIERGNRYCDFWSYSGWMDAPIIASNEVWLNENLARHLGVQPGAEVVFRLRKPTSLSAEVPISDRPDNSLALRFRFTQTVQAQHLGNFNLQESSVPVFNAFVNVETLQRALSLPAQANLLVSGGVRQSPSSEIVESLKYNLSRRDSSLADWLGRLLPSGKQEDRSADRAREDLQQTLAGNALLVDYESALHVIPGRRELELNSRRVFLDQALAKAVAGTPDAESLAVDGETGLTNDWLQAALDASQTNCQKILTYLANLITVGTNATPYSMVTAAGAPWTPAGLRDDEIVLNQWLADDLHAKPGDALSLVYFDPESGARLTERTNTFRVHSIVPMQMPWADRTLMPQFPGIEKAETTAEWDTAFPLVHPIRSQDDDYWTDHRGTPKAFITLAAGQKMWANRFGNLTAIRFPVPTNLLSATTALTPALSPGERENPSPPHEKTGAGDSPESTRTIASVPKLSPLPGGEGQGEGRRSTNSVEIFRAALEKKILATLKPEELGLRFEPVREQALKAAEQSQDFGGLFIGFSLFVIVAALLLMALLFQFSLEQRATEIGTLLALGFTPKQVRRLFLREGAALAFAGGILGTLGGIGYARGMLHGLSTIWRDAVGASTLNFFVTPQTLVIGLLASTIVAVFTLWFALRKQARQPARVLLTGEDIGLKMEGGATKRSRSSLVGMAALIAAIGLIGWMLAKGDTANAGAFFGAGALTLTAGLCLLNAWFVRLLQPSSILHSPSASTLALRGLARRRSRSVATVAMLACGTFLIISIGVFRLDANRDATQRASGTGGFALIGESTMPVVADLNTKAGRETFALNEADFVDVNVVQFRVRQGDEASCLNLNRAQKPRLLGVNSEQLEGRFTFAKGDEWRGLSSALSVPHSALEVPAIGDAASIQWAMGKKMGDTLDYVDERGQAFKVRIVGAVANSILQGQLIIDEAEFVARFPGESGYKYFLIDAPTNRVADLSAKLSRALQDTGLELTPAPVRLAQFNAVQNTYLGTFQVLGGLGLLLGSAGLGIVVLRNVLERRGELAVLLAVGWRQASVRGLVLREHVALLGLGLLVGLTAAAVAVLPGFFAAANQLPVFTLALTLALVVANGLAFTWLATRYALRGNLLAALRNE
jgi:ABC-type antimicrobial peptide transport system permease subunit